MAWSTDNTRNIYLAEATTLNRGLEFLSFMDHHLCEGSAGWTRVGSGAGTAGAFGWGATKVLPVYPSITGMAANAWSVWRNASGAEWCIQVNNVGYGAVWWSPAAGFVTTGISEVIPPSTTGTPPADMVTHAAAGESQVGRAIGYISMAYSDDRESFVVFGRRPIADEFGIAFLKLEDTKVGDTAPYWGFVKVSSGSSVWIPSVIGQTTASMLTTGYHPLTGPQIYGLADLRVYNSVTVLDNLPADPVSGKIQLLECLCLCGVPGSLHIRGKANGIYRVPSVLGTGDRINHLGAGVYEYVVIDSYAVPWNSSDAMLW